MCDQYYGDVMVEVIHRLHHRHKLMFGKQLIEQRLVHQITHHQLPESGGLSMSCGQVIEHNGEKASSSQVLDHVGADITCPADN